MTDLHHVRIHGGTNPGLEIDGHQVYATSAIISFDPARLPSLIVELPVTQTDIDVQALIRVSDPAGQALKALGWTPPQESP